MPKQKNRWQMAALAVVLSIVALAMLVLPVGMEEQPPLSQEQPSVSESVTPSTPTISSPTPSEEQEVIGSGSVGDFNASVAPSEQPSVLPVSPSKEESALPSDTASPTEPSVTPEPTPLPSESLPPAIETVEPVEPTVPVEPSKPIEPTMPPETEEQIFYITMHDKERDEIVKMPFEEFVVYAMAAEIDSYVPPEAMKAQAVAIRSFVLANLGSHEDVMVCNDTDHCMAVCTKAYFEGLKDYQQQKYIDAVRSTKGQILMYKGDVAKTYFHWCSYRNTESAESSFGKYYPYLVPVSTSVEEDFIQEKVFTSKTLLKKLFGSRKAEKLLAKEGVKPLGAIVLTDGGRIDTVEIYGETVTGKELRAALGLRSTDVLIGYAPETQEFSLTVYGWGHGVGMSQVGAEVMAKEGSSYSEILYHYYKGTLLSIMTDKNFK